MTLLKPIKHRDPYRILMDEQMHDIKELAANGFDPAAPLGPQGKNAFRICCENGLAQPLHALLAAFPSKASLLTQQDSIGIDCVEAAAGVGSALCLSAMAPHLATPRASSGRSLAELAVACSKTQPNASDALLADSIAQGAHLKEELRRARELAIEMGWSAGESRLAEALGLGARRASHAESAVGKE